jgi:PKD repeat protein
VLLDDEDKVLTGWIIAIPSTGLGPLGVRLAGQVAGGKPPYTFSWDLNGHGVYEYSSATTPATIYTYTNKGSYKALIEVTDNSGLMNTGFVMIRVDSAPQAKAGANPRSGPSPLELNFVGMGSYSDGMIVLWGEKYGN